MSIFIVYNFAGKIVIYVYAGIILETEGSIQQSTMLINVVLFVFKLENKKELHVSAESKYGAKKLILLRAKNMVHNKR